MCCTYERFVVAKAIAKAEGGEVGCALWRVMARGVLCALGTFDVYTRGGVVFKRVCACAPTALEGGVLVELKGPLVYNTLNNRGRICGFRALSPGAPKSFRHRWRG